jgi:hypothetical protein
MREVSVVEHAISKSAHAAVARQNIEPAPTCFFNDRLPPGAAGALGPPRRNPVTGNHNPRRVMIGSSAQTAVIRRWSGERVNSDPEWPLDFDQPKLRSLLKRRGQCARQIA